MNKASHKRKLKMARKMRTQAETSRKLKIKNKKVVYGYKNVFDSKAWNDRKQAIADRVKRKQAKAHARAVARKAKLKKTKKANV